MSGPPPWGAREPEPELTPDGRPILRTKHGPHVKDEQGRWVPFFDQDEEMRMTLGPMLRRREGEPVVVPGDWSPW